MFVLLTSHVLASDNQIIVKFRTSHASADRQFVQSKMVPLSVRMGTQLQYSRAMSGGAHVLQLPADMSQTDIDAYLKQLTADGDIEYAQLNRRVFPQRVPDDALYADDQWNLKAISSSPGAANIESAWDLTTGTANIVVAVIDTGILPFHPDIEGKIVSQYDFISDNFSANDGNGRDTDATDPGDWIAEDETQLGVCPIGDSSWHGTHVAGIIAANTDNSIGVAGINWQTGLLIGRVLGKCGGFLSDIVDAIYWSAGLPVTNVPAPSKAAKVINLSLGMTGNCGPAEQAAIDAATVAGAVVVTASGNSGVDTDSTAFTPGNCNNVINVAAFDRNGSRALYSNYGSSIDIAASGGSMSTLNDPNGILSTLDSGQNSAENDDTYIFYQGTSMAAPHVSGVVSLMLAANSSLTPAEIETMIKSSAQTFPINSNCLANKCGAGLLDAQAAIITATNGGPIADTGGNLKVDPEASVTLDGSDSIDSSGGAITNYEWSQLSGTTVTLNDANTQTANFQAPATTAKLTFQLQVTDDDGNTAQNTMTVSVGNNNPPTANASTLAIKKNTVGTGQLSGADTDGDTITYHIAIAPEHGSAVITDNSTGEFTYTADAGFTGYDTFSFQSHDGELNSESAKVTVTVTRHRSSNALGSLSSLTLIILLLLGFRPVYRQLLRFL